MLLLTGLPAAARSWRCGTSYADEGIEWGEADPEPLPVNDPSSMSMYFRDRRHLASEGQVQKSIWVASGRVKQANGTARRLKLYETTGEFSSGRQVRRSFAIEN
jgi:hypothetical protein